MAEIVYVFTNPSMPDVVKIGKTTQSVEERRRSLSNSTSVPEPFVCYYAAIVKDCSFVEKKLHELFSEQRCNLKREFFKVHPRRVQMAIELAAIEDITPRVNADMPEEDVRLLAEINRRQVFRFSLAKVPPDAILNFARDNSKTCRVLDDRYVEFEGQPTTLTGAASKILRSMGWKSGNVAGPLYWLYEEESLDERRRRFEEDKLLLDSVN